MTGCCHCENFLSCDQLTSPQNNLYPLPFISPWGRKVSIAGTGRCCGAGAVGVELGFAQQRWLGASSLCAQTCARTGPLSGPWHRTWPVDVTATPGTPLLLPPGWDKGSSCSSTLKGSAGCLETSHENLILGKTRVWEKRWLWAEAVGWEGETG